MKAEIGKKNAYFSFLFCSFSFSFLFYMYFEIRYDIFIVSNQQYKSFFLFFF